MLIDFYHPVAQRLQSFYGSLVIKPYKIYIMPTTKNRSTKTKSSSSTRQSRATVAKAKEKPVSKKTTNTEMPESNGHSQLEKLFLDSLKDIYWAEKHLTKVLPKMKKKATSDELKEAIEEHLAQTEEHVSRLEQVFNLCGKKPQAKKCEAMDGLTREGDSIIEETEDGTETRDAGIIMAAQKVEHYEIATYGTLVVFAKTLGMKEAADILIETLKEEKDTDERLTAIAEGNVNMTAEQEAGEEDENEDVEDSETESEDEDTEKEKDNEEGE
jgi:ferritin-like metal-binding protein YciE